MGWHCSLPSFLSVCLSHPLTAVGRAQARPDMTALPCCAVALPCLLTVATVTRPWLCCRDHGVLLPAPARPGGHPARAGCSVSGGCGWQEGFGLSRAALQPPKPAGKPKRAGRPRLPKEAHVFLSKEEIIHIFNNFFKDQPIISPTPGL